MLIRIAAIASLVALSGCAALAPSIPASYSGPQARLQDSVVVHSGSKADLFVAEQLGGKDVDNSIRRTQQASQGRGFALSTVNFDRPIVAGQPIVVAVRGRTVFAAPIQALASTVYPRFPISPKV